LNGGIAQGVKRMSLGCVPGLPPPLPPSFSKFDVSKLSYLIFFFFLSSHFLPYFLFYCSTNLSSYTPPDFALVLHSCVFILLLCSDTVTTSTPYLIPDLFPF
jgi:hypothetical protein